MRTPLSIIIVPAGDGWLHTVVHINATAAGINHRPAAVLTVNAAHQQRGICLKGFEDQSQTQIWFRLSYKFNLISLWSGTSHISESMSFGFYPESSLCLLLSDDRIAGNLCVCVSWTIVCLSVYKLQWTLFIYWLIRSLSLQTSQHNIAGIY